MSYVDQQLIKGEQILYRARLHWKVFIPAVIFALIDLAMHFVFVLAAVVAVLSYLSYSTSELALTNRRVVGKVGVVRRASVDNLLTKVEGVSVDQGILGRMLGYGTVVVRGTGAGHAGLPAIAQPDQFSRRVQQQIADLESGAARTV